MYVTYKITCKTTGKFYIGSHKTNNLNDGYMGSGRFIKESIQIYGKENHTKEILAIFDNRKESIALEHFLVEYYKFYNKDLVLNVTNGGFSFDYINDNLHFDRGKFAKMASHDYAQKKKRENIETYNLNPKLCLICGTKLPYEKRRNKFCSRSCAATYNNSHSQNRPRAQSNIIICKQCGKEIITRRKNKKFCDSKCAGIFINQHKPPTQKRIKILNALESIAKRQKTESLRQIAKDYGVSATFIKDALKGRLNLGDEQIKGEHNKNERKQTYI